MAEETDGIEEAFDGELRVLVTAAGQIAERVARAREDASRRAQMDSEQAARELKARFEAERKTVHLEVSRVHGREWWDRATPEQMAHTYQLARAWAQDDAEAARAEQTMRTEFHTRYDMDTDTTGADPAAVRSAVQRAETARAAADAEHQRSAGEAAEAQLLLDQAAREDRRADEVRLVAEDENEPEKRGRLLAEEQSGSDRSAGGQDEGRILYDSAERREETARDLESKGIDSETAATRMRADVSQAKPAIEAVKVNEVKTSKNTRRRGPRAAQVQRPGLNR